MALDFDVVVRDGVEYTLFPVPDGGSALYKSAAGRVYSNRVEHDPAVGKRKMGLYCAADRVMVTVDGRKVQGMGCVAKPNVECAHQITPEMDQFHQVLRASKLMCCDLLSLGKMEMTKANVSSVLLTLFTRYAPNYPTLDVGRIYENRKAGFRFILGQKNGQGGLKPWAVPRGAPEVDLGSELNMEVLRHPEYDGARDLLIGRYDTAHPDPEVQEVVNPGPHELALFEAARRLGEETSLTPVEIVVRFVGPRGGHVSRTYVVRPPLEEEEEFVEGVEADLVLSEDSTEEEDRE
jgi:hypothetical protein